jgi:cytoskeletal protein CcmA (bactofilin family)
LVSELEGTVSGNIKSSKVHISGTGDIEGTIKQKTLSIDEGAKLKIKTETSK